MHSATAQHALKRQPFVCDRPFDLCRRRAASCYCTSPSLHLRRPTRTSTSSPTPPAHCLAVATPLKLSPIQSLAHRRPQHRRFQQHSRAQPRTTSAYRQSHLCVLQATARLREHRPFPFELFCLLNRPLSSTTSGSTNVSCIIEPTEFKMPSECPQICAHNGPYWAALVQGGRESPGQTIYIRKQRTTATNIKVS